MMIGLVALACGVTGISAQADEAATSNIPVHAQVGDPAPAHVQLHWRNDDGSIGDAEMEPDGECDRVATIPSGTDLAYWIDATGADGTVIARAGTADAPLHRTWSEFAPWCDEPCSCGGGCPIQQEVGIAIAPPPAPASRRFRIELTGGITSDAAPIGALAIGGFVARDTEVVLAAQLAHAPLALVELRELVSGRRGLALEIAAGGWHVAVAGGGAAYVIGLGGRIDAIASTTALVDAHGTWRLDAEAGVSLAW